MTAAHELAEALRAIEKLEQRFAPIIEAGDIDPDFPLWLCHQAERFIIGAKEYGSSSYGMTMGVVAQNVREELVDAAVYPFFSWRKWKLQGPRHHGLSEDERMEGYDANAG